MICTLDDIRGDLLWPPHDTIPWPAAVITNQNRSLDPLRVKKTFIKLKMGQTVQFRIILVIPESN